MSVTISASGYDNRFIFEGATRKGDNTTAGSAATAAVPAAAAVTPTVAVARSGLMSQLASSLGVAGLTRGGASTDAAQAGGSATLDSLDADAKSKLTDAMSTLMDALAGAAGTATGSTVQDAIKTVVSTLGPMAETTPQATATGMAGTSSSSGAGEGANKPNLDILNRVLSHYTAQNTASETVLSLVS